MKKLRNYLLSTLLILGAFLLFGPSKANASMPFTKRLVIGSAFDYKYDAAKECDVVTGFTRILRTLTSQKEKRTAIIRLSLI